MAKRRPRRHREPTPLARFIKKVREEIGEVRYPGDFKRYSQSEFADDWKVTQVEVGRFESGARIPSARAVKLLRELIGREPRIIVSVDDLLDRWLQAQDLGIFVEDINRRGRV